MGTRDVQAEPAPGQGMDTGTAGAGAAPCQRGQVLCPPWALLCGCVAPSPLSQMPPGAGAQAPSRLSWGESGNRAGGGCGWVTVPGAVLALRGDFHRVRAAG